MEPAVTVALLWLLFGGTHVLLTTRALRSALVATLGEPGFRALYSAIAVATFTVLVRGYAAHRTHGAPGLDLGRYAALRPVLMAIVVAGVTLMFVMDYAKSPTALFDQPIRTPRGAERITRHPFFAGVALLALAHAWLATRLAGTVFFAGLAALAIGGAWHQDRKLLARRGAPYRDYLAATSAVPFAAIVDGRQPFRPREIALRGVLTGLGIAIVLRAIHGAILSHDGAWLVAAVVVGAAVSTLRAWRRAARVGLVTREAPVARVP